MKYTISLLLMVLSANMVFAQKADTLVQTHEYAMIQANVFYQGNTLRYNVMDAHQTPALVMPDGKTYIAYANTQTKEQFENLGQLINFMALYGWRMISNHTIAYEGDGGNTSKNLTFNTNEYVATMIFERKIK